MSHSNNNDNNYGKHNPDFGDLYEQIRKCITDPMASSQASCPEPQTPPDDTAVPPPMSGIAPPPADTSVPPPVSEIAPPPPTSEPPVIPTVEMTSAAEKWQKAYTAYKKSSLPQPTVSTASRHEYHEDRGYATCCPYCGEVHYRSDCYYDLADILRLYIKYRNPDLTHLLSAIPSVLFTHAEIKDIINNNKGHLKLTYKDIFLRMSRAVAYFAATLSDHVIENSHDLEKQFGEAVEHTKLLTYQPSIYMYATTRKNPDSHDYTSDKLSSNVLCQNIIDAFGSYADTCVLDVIISCDNVSSPNCTIKTRGLAPGDNGVIISNITLMRCPACGNPLAENAGVLDEVIVGMLGLPSAGKTTSIYALDHIMADGHIISTPDGTYSLELCSLANDVGSGIELEGKHKENQQHFSNGEPIEKTPQKHRFYRIITAKIHHFGKCVGERNVIFADIAGEDGAEGNGILISYQLADCYWYCVTPEQTGITQFTDDHDSGETAKYVTSNVRDNILSFYKAMFSERKPVAVIYTRSDYYATSALLASHSSYTDYIFTTDKEASMAEPGKYLVAPCDNENHLGLLISPMRNYSYQILKFMRTITQHIDTGKVYCGRLAETTGSTETNAYVAGGSKSPCSLSFLDARQAPFMAFACSPYGFKPVTGHQKSPSPFGVVMPLIWTLCFSGTANSPALITPVYKDVAQNSFTGYIPFDESTWYPWMFINQNGTLPQSTNDTVTTSRPKTTIGSEFFEAATETLGRLFRRNRD